MSSHPQPNPSEPSNQSQLDLQAAGRRAARSVWLKNLHQWHWISSALCLLGMLLFSFTGITLNHAAQIEAKPRITTKTATLPLAMQTVLKQAATSSAATGAASGTSSGKAGAPLPVLVSQWLEQNWALSVALEPAEWSPDEVYLPLPRPGGDAWLRIGIDDGAVEYERTDRGWISWLNDLHKGRNTGVAWSWFIDIFAASCLIFSITGLLILKFHAANRPFTWPMVGLGMLIPVLIALVFIH